MAGAAGRDTVAALWHYLGRSGELTLETDKLAFGGVVASRMDATPVPTIRRDGKTVLPLDGRRTVVRFTGLPVAEALRLLARARWESPRHLAGR
jgi:hypothetical protein